MQEAHSFPDADVHDPFRCGQVVVMVNDVHAHAHHSRIIADCPMGRLGVLVVGLALCAGGSQAALQLPARCTGSRQSGSLDARARGESSSNLGCRALWFRGGANKPAKGKAVKSKGLSTKKSAIKSVQEVLVQVKPATRFYMALSLFCTLVHMTGLPAPALFNLDMSRLWEIWRPLTAVAYLGAPSMSMANSIYFLVRYGQQLETLNGLGAHAWFLLVQTAILTFLGLLLGFPFTAQAMIAATVYVSSHLNPMERMPFQFGFVITSWQLPFAMMAIDCLSVREKMATLTLFQTRPPVSHAIPCCTCSSSTVSRLPCALSLTPTPSPLPTTQQQNAAAAWPHVLGILSGHSFHFFTKLWPALGGRAWLDPPKWWLKRLGGAPRGNVQLSSRAGKAASKGKRKSTGVPRKLGPALPVDSAS